MFRGYSLFRPTIRVIMDRNDLPRSENCNRAICFEISLKTFSILCSFSSLRQLLGGLECYSNSTFFLFQVNVSIYQLLPLERRSAAASTSYPCPYIGMP